MFGHDDFDEDDWFKGHSKVFDHHNWDSHWDSQWEVGGGGAMDIVIGIAVVFGIAVLLAICCRCCRSTKYRGRVLQPAPDPNSTVPVPPGPNVAYPQQQYSTVTVTTLPVTALPVGHGGGAPYPSGGAPYPTNTPYPAAGAAYPGGAGPYPGAAPYPMAGAPYPAVSAYPPAGPYPTSMPQPAVPSAPDAHAFIGIAPPGWHAQAMPPSYDQVMSNESKHPPFNPYAPQ